MSNPAKRGNAPPSGDTPGKKPPKQPCIAQPRSRKTLFQSELKPPVGIYLQLYLFVFFNFLLMII